AGAAARAAVEAQAAAHLAATKAGEVQAWTDGDGESAAPAGTGDAVHRLDTAAIEERLRQVTPGRWARHGCDVWAEDGGGPALFVTPRERDSSSQRREQADRDAEFVAHAPDDVRALLAELRAVRDVDDPAG
ncbi:MAG: hypothetical protein JWM18_2926, partial [Chloroflexi bacterium]|nr:hypothetical protein [Chloroflexota bacterium]